MIWATQMQQQLYTKRCVCSTTNYNTQTHTHTYSLSLSLARSRSLSRTHTNTHKRTHAHTHTHTCVSLWRRRSNRSVYNGVARVDADRHKEKKKGGGA